MFMAKSVIRVKIDINSLWNIFIDYQNWQKWDPSIKKAWLENNTEFQQGAKGKLERASGRIADFEIVEFKSPYAYTTKTRLPLGCKLFYRHEVAVDPVDQDYCIITDVVYLEGIFSFVFKIYLGDMLQQDTDIALIKMKQLYEPSKED